jgi:hypothetical protein
LFAPVATERTALMAMPTIAASANLTNTLVGKMMKEKKMITKQESEEIRAQFLEAKQEAYLYGRAVERRATLKAIEELLADGDVPPKTIINSIMTVLKKKVKKDGNEKVA